MQSNMNEPPHDLESNSQPLFLKSSPIFLNNFAKLPLVSQIGNKQLIALLANTQIKLTTTHPVKKPLEKM